MILVCAFKNNHQRRVLFEGNIDFYGKSGFDYARNFGIRYHDLPEGADDSLLPRKSQ